MIKIKIIFSKICLLAITLLFINNRSSGNTNDNKEDRLFMAGAATVNITPPVSDNDTEDWYGQKQDFFVSGGTLTKRSTANHIHDDFHARCLILDDSKIKLVFIVIDNVTASRELYDEAKKIINDETGIPVENILMSITHTHSIGGARIDGSPFNGYQKFLIRRLADVVRIALNNMEPAQIGWGTGTLPDHLFVRRWIMKPGANVPNPFGGQDRVRMNPGIGNPDLLKPAGTPDPEFSFISVQSTGGKPIALLANYSLHYVGGVPAGHISADYFAVFADRIQELLKADRQDPPFVGILSNGTSGDVNNINYGGNPENYPPYKKIKIVADDLAGEVFRIHNKIEFYNWVPLKVAHTELPLKIRKPDSEMIKYAKEAFNKPDKRVGPHGSEKFYHARALKMLEWPEYVNIILQTFSIGDLAIAAIPFETFSETGLEIKEKSPFKTTFTIEMANGGYGYLPTPEQHQLGGYETWISINRVEKEASVKIVTKLLEMFATIHN